MSGGAGDTMNGGSAPQGMSDSAASCSRPWSAGKCVRSHA